MRRTEPGIYSSPPHNGQAAYGLYAAPAMTSTIPVACASPETPASFCGDDVRKALAEKTPTRNSINLERSEEHTSELQSLAYLVCRLLLEKKKKRTECSDS